MNWESLDPGATIGRPGSEEGVIWRDEEHGLGARITMEEDGTHAPFAVTCGIYGWMFHTRFLRDRAEAEASYETMKIALAEILQMIPPKTDPDADEKCSDVADAISTFVGRFPERSIIQGLGAVAVGVRLSSCPLSVRSAAKKIPDRDNSGHFRTLAPETPLNPPMTCRKPPFT